MRCCLASFVFTVVVEQGFVGCRVLISGVLGKLLLKLAFLISFTELHFPLHLWFSCDVPRLISLVVCRLCRLWCVK